MTTFGYQPDIVAVGAKLDNKNGFDHESVARQPKVAQLEMEVETAIATMWHADPDYFAYFFIR